MIAGRETIIRSASRLPTTSCLEDALMSFEEIFTYIPRLIGFLLTLPIRWIFGVDFDWGIRS